MILATLIWLLLDNSHWHYIQDVLRRNQDDKLLWQVNRALEQENTLLRDKVLMLEQTTDIDKQTAGIVQAEIKNQQDEIHQLKDELQFYREIMDSASGANGLDVQGVYIKPLAEAGGYRMKLVLTHIGKAGKVTKGTLTVMLEGRAGDKKHAVSLADISLGEDQRLTYNFRHFQRIETDFMLPENFKPQRIVVNVTDKNRQGSRVKKAFSWSESTTRR